MKRASSELTFGKLLKFELSNVLSLNRFRKKSNPNFHAVRFWLVAIAIFAIVLLINAVVCFLFDHEKMSALIPTLVLNANLIVGFMMILTRIRDVLFHPDTLTLFGYMPINQKRLMVARIVTIYLTIVVINYLCTFIILGYYATCPITPMYGFERTTYLTIFTLLLPFFTSFVVLVAAIILSLFYSFLSSLLPGKNGWYYGLVITTVVLWWILLSNSMSVDEKAWVVFRNTSWFFYNVMLYYQYPVTIASIGIIILFLIIALFGNQYYDLCGISIKKSRVEKIHRYRQKRHSQFRALLNTEVKRTANPVVLLNACFGGIILIVFAISQVIISVTNNHQALISFPINFFVIGLLAGFSSPCYTAISLEGRQHHIIGTAPVPDRKILTVKFFPQLFFVTIPCIIGAGIIGIYYASLGIWTVRNALDLISMSIFVTLVNGLLGLIINARINKFDWTRTIKCVKNSLPVLLGLLINVVVWGGALALVMNVKMETKWIVLTTFLLLTAAIIGLVWLFRRTKIRWGTTNA